jgi:hypothetical protein
MTARLRRVRIPLLTAVALVFIIVSSGAFGIEDMVGSDGSGPGLTLELLLVGVYLPVGRLGRVHRPRPGLHRHVVAATSSPSAR